MNNVMTPFSSAAAKSLRSALRSLLAVAAIAAVSAASIGAAPVVDPVETWRKEGNAISNMIDQDVALAYQQASAWFKATPVDATESDRIWASIVLADTESYSGRAADAEAHASQAKAAAQAKGLATREAQANIILIGELEYRGNYDEAERLAAQAKELFRKDKRTAEELRADGLAINSRFRKGLVDQAVVSAQENFDHALRDGNPRIIADAALDMAWGVYQSDDFAGAARYAREALENAQKTPSLRLQAQALECLAAATGRSGNRPRAEELFREGLRLYRRIGDPYGVIVAGLNLAINLKNQERYDEALVLLEETHGLLQKHPWKALDREYQSCTSALYRAKGEPAKALAAAERAYELATEMGLPAETAESLDEIAQSAAATGDFRRAYEAAVDLADANTRAEKERIAKRVAELEAVYAAERRKREIAQLENTNRRKEQELQEERAKHDRLRLLTLCGVTALGLVSILLFRERRVRLRIARLAAELESAKRDLEQNSRLQAAVLDSTHFGLIALDAATGRIRVFNAGAEHMLGHARSKVLDQEAPALFCDPAELAARIAEVTQQLGRPLTNTSEAWTALAARDGSETREWALLHRDGQRVPVLLDVTAQRRPDGALSSFVCFLYDLSERKRAETEVIAGRERLATILDTASEGFILIDESGRFIECNAGLERLLGCPRHELLQENAFAPRFHFFRESGDEFPPASFPILIALRTGVAQREVTARLAKPDGSSAWISVSAEPVRDSAGVVHLVVASFADITARKLYEENLLQTAMLRERLSGLARAVPGLLFTFRRDTQGRDTFPFASPGIHELFDMRPEEIQDDASALFSRFFPEDRERLLDLLAETSATLEQFRTEIRFSHPERGTIWADLRSTPQQQTDGAVEWHGVIVDISQQKRTEQALAESENKHRTIFESANDGIFLQRILDTGAQPRLILHDLNRKCCELVGASVEEIISGHCDLFAIGEPPYDEAAALRHGHLAAAGQAQVFDWPLRRSGDEIAWGEVSLKRVRLGDHDFILGMIREITEHKRLAAELSLARDRALDAARAKAQFLANMSHEIRTPMNGVLGMAEALGSSRLDDTQREMVRLLRSSSESLLTVINDILDYSKIEAGRLQIESIPYDPAVVVRDAVSLFAPTAATKNLRLACRIAPECEGTSLGDPNRLRQVLCNLIGNAVKFTAQGSVDVTARVVPGVPARLRVDVQDTGIGIPPERCRELFTAFMQADQSHSRKFGGTGLGLAISRQLVNLLGGQIDCESRVGEGTLFWFEIPLPRAEGALASAPAEDTVPTPVRALRLLVADDYESNRIVLKFLVADEPYTIDFVENGRAAIERLAAADFDAVLMDCQMPEVDGFTATRMIRDGAVPEPRTRTPIIALTGYATAEDRARCLEAGMTDFISKPMRKADLQRALARCLPQAFRAAPAASAPSAPPPWDPSFVRQLEGMTAADGSPLLPRILEMFFDDAPRFVAEIRAALSERRATDLAAIAHKFAGCAGNMGGLEARRIACELEKAARKQQWEQADTLFASLEAEWIRLAAFLRQHPEAPR
ncbi:MAG TPA: PAS domain S-box protein [Opitutaceae bacterium]|nr:PAS domain S-box protein [Opitutaceae bacterium]